MVEIIKSTRHAKIIGDFGENLICNWLSRSGFEATIVDHTGIDIVAYNTKTNQRIGITIKSRTRTTGKETDPVNLFSYQHGKNECQSVLNACQAFACEPWIGVYVEATEYGEVYLTSLENYQKNYRTKAGKAIDDWKMTPAYQEKYKKDALIKYIRIDFQSENWEW